MEIFAHTAGAEHPVLIEVEETTTVRTLLLEEDPDGHVWIEEIDEEIDLDLTLIAAGIGHHHHVHRGRCRRIEVLVRYNGEKFERIFGPSKTIKHVAKWAFGPDGAALSKEQAATHALTEPGADHPLEGSVHVGSLVKPDSCSVTLDVVPRSRHAG